MARNIKFPLKMQNGSEVRTLEELRNNFDIESVIGYYANGQLVTWLKNYYYDDIADKIDTLDKNAPDISKQVCEVLGVEYVESGDISLDEAKEKLERDKLIKQLLTEEQMKCLATNQEELKIMRLKKTPTIYLAFGEFELIPPDPDLGVNSEYVILKETNPKITFVNGSIEWITKYAEQGNATAQSRLGDYYSSDFSPYKDYTKAIEWYTKASEQGDGDASFNLGQMFSLGLGVNMDDNKAVEWYKKASEQGSDFAAYRLGMHYYNQVYSFGNFPRNNDELKIALNAIKWFEVSTENGDKDAFDYLDQIFSISNILYMYDEGNFSTESRSHITEFNNKAFKWIKNKVTNGDIDSLSLLATMYFNGYGTEIDYVEARELFRKATENNDTYAMIQLGFMYKNGYGVTPNEEIADEWYSKASSMENFHFDISDLLKAADEYAVKENVISSNPPKSCLNFELVKLLKAAEEEAAKETETASTPPNNSFNFDMAELLKKAEEEAAKETEIESPSQNSNFDFDMVDLLKLAEEEAAKEMTKEMKNNSYSL